MTIKALVIPAALLALQLATLPSLAQSTTAADQASRPELLLELNALQPSDKGCRLTFVVTNDLGAELEQAAFEIAMFNQQGLVDRLTVLDFKDLPVGKTKVTRFDLAGADCAGISRVLINTATECKGQGVEPKACIRQLKPQSRSGIRFGT